MPAPDPDRPGSDPELVPPGGPGYCTVAAQLCRLHVWTEAQYDQLAAAERPARAAHVPGLGWLVALPLESLN